MLKPVQVRISIHETDRQCLCHKLRGFPLKLMPEMNGEHVFEGAFEG